MKCDNSNNICVVMPIAGISVLYFVFTLFLLFQNYSDVKQIMYWFYPDLEHEKPDEKV